MDRARSGIGVLSGRTIVWNLPKTRLPEGVITPTATSKQIDKRLLEVPPITTDQQSIDDLRLRWEHRISLLNPIKVVPSVDDMLDNRREDTGTDVLEQSSDRV